MLRLSARQSLTTQIPQQSIALQHYLKQPRRLVSALMNPSQVEDLGQGNFRLSLRAIQFLMLKIRPVVDLHIDGSQPCLLKVRSIGCKIDGNEFIDQRFRLSLLGSLRVRDQGGMAHLKGLAELAIAVDLPPVLRLTPHAILEKTGNQILRGILATMKQRLIRQLAADYKRWSDQQSAPESAIPMLGTAATQASCLDG